MPASVAAECFQAHERFVPGLTPKLPGALEAGLILSASRFHRSAAQWFAALAGRSIVQSITMGLQVVDFLVHLFARGTFQPFSQLLQVGDEVIDFRNLSNLWRAGANNGRGTARHICVSRAVR